MVWRRLTAEMRQDHGGEAQDALGLLTLIEAKAPSDLSDAHVRAGLRRACGRGPR